MAKILPILNFFLICATLWLAVETRKLVMAQWKPYIHAYIIRLISKGKIRGYELYVENVGKGPALEIEVNPINGQLDCLNINKSHKFDFRSG